MIHRNGLFNMGDQEEWRYLYLCRFILAETQCFLVRGVAMAAARMEVMHLEVADGRPTILNDDVIGVRCLMLLLTIVYRAELGGARASRLHVRRVN